MILRMSKSAAHLALLTGLAATASSLPALAQQPAPWGGEAQRPAAGQKGPVATPKAQKATPPAKAKEDAAPQSEGQLRQRVEQLEEQLADMQVMIGTLESLGKGGTSAPARVSGAAAGGGGGGVDQARIDSLETQMRALSAQVEQLTNELRQQGRRGDVRAPDTFGAPPRQQASAEPTPVRGFGAVTVTPDGERDPIGRIIGDPAPPPAAALPADAQAATSAKQLYETSYAYLLQQDYGAAEVSFEEFLRRYPTDRQAADAQYWYAETLYVQRRYKPAGQAFLRVVEKHPASSKVPNSLLKLAQSLEQLGQKDCALFGELEAKHPNAPTDVRSKARALKQRVGC